MPPGVARRSLGFEQFLPIVAETLGAPLGERGLERIMRRQGHRLAAIAGRSGLVHCVEGLALEYARRGRDAPLIVERRALHPAAFAEGLAPCLDIPATVLPYESWLAERLEEETDQASRLLVYSEGAKASFVRHGFPPDQVSVVPLGTDSPPPLIEQCREADPYRLLFIGTASAVKGIDVAVATVEQLGPPYTLTVAGGANEEMRSWLESRGQVSYVGQLSRSALNRLAQEAAVLLAPAKESFGLAALDAAAQGCHVLGLNTMGLSDWLPAEAGTFLAQRDPAVWSAAIGGMLSSGREVDPETRLATANSAATLSWENSGRRLAAVYAQHAP